MQALEDSGLDELAIECAGSGRPFLGVCVGMQMLYEGSEESPDVPGLGVLPGIVRLLPDGVKRPQMQWNLLRALRPRAACSPGCPTRRGSTSSTRSPPSSDEHAVATCDYGGPVVAAVEREALWATQFHPEKSGAHRAAHPRATSSAAPRPPAEAA